MIIRSYLALTLSTLGTYARHSKTQPIVDSNRDVWSDYPAFALREPPKGPSPTVVVNYGLLGKKHQAVVPGSDPVFDIVVTPDYVPEPFPAPYPFPIPVEDRVADTLEVEASRNSHTVKAVDPLLEHTVDKYLEKAEAFMKCPENYIQSGTECVYNDIKPSYLGCPEGWKFDVDKCVAVSVTNPDFLCPEGFLEAIDAGKRICVQDITAPKQMVCPPGYNQTVKGCQKAVYSPPALQCAKGELVNGRCETFSVSKPQLVCKVGFELNPDMTSCLQLHELAPQNECELDMVYDPILHKCSKYDVIPKQKQCDAGFIFNGQICEQITFGEPLLSCPVGSVLEQGSCKKTLELGAPLVACPVGFELSEDATYCSRHSHSSKKNQPKNSQRSKDGHHGHGHDHHERIEPTVQCPDGAGLYNGKCVRYEVFSSAVSCSHGFVLQEGRCVKLTTASPILTCPPNYVSEASNSCSTILRADPVVRCPDYYELTPDGRKCVRYNRLPPELRCPMTSVLELEYGVSREAACLMRDATDAQAYCVLDRSVLVEQNGELKCESIHIVQPSFICIDGFYERGDSCFKRITAELTPVCGLNYSFSFDQCVKQEEMDPLVLCPEGFRLGEDPSSCVNTHVLEALYDCPAGFTYDELVRSCYKFVEIAAIKSNHMHEEPPAEALKDLHVEPPPKKSSKKMIHNGEGDGLGGGMRGAGGSRSRGGSSFGGAYGNLDGSRGGVYRNDNDLDMPDFDIPLEEDFDYSMPRPKGEYFPPRPIPSPYPLPQNEPRHSLTILHQPVMIPQPAIILPQQAPVPQPPSIKVPYPVPQPIAFNVRG